MGIYFITRHNGRVKALDGALGVLITPPGVDEKTALAAWSYAVRYSAKGLDVPDFHAAAALLLKRHPSWQCLMESVSNVWYDGGSAELDKPD